MRKGGSSRTPAAANGRFSGIEIAGPPVCSCSRVQPYYFRDQKINVGQVFEIIMTVTVLKGSVPISEH